MNSPREEVTFVARSENRVAVLSTMDDRPITRTDLEERANVSRVTLGRILADFEDRGWVEETGGGYNRTPTGEMVAGALDELFETIAVARKLDSVVQWLPTEEMPFDLQRLGSADVTLPGPADPAAPTRRAGQRLRDTVHVRLLMSVIVAEVVEACWDATVNGNQQFEGVFTPEVAETMVTDPTMSAQVAEMVQTDQVTIYLTEEPFPFIQGLLDDIVAFGVTDEENLPRAYFETQDETVRAWVESTYTHYRNRAEEVTPESFGF
ncbi:helix-turn-helix transcriptional regulator [Haloarchaeobius sp. DFWS5]|uniref:helix-turn-helix transcriptional regulator n=1 Tax=Haloarchaeobius sp. DFWS5 TaxID=3446114 RepID=UPI003EBC9403